MIITRLEGGLGNQMFEYAAARWLSHKYSTPLKLDLSWFEVHTLRQYNLNCFNIHVDFATDREIEAIVGNYNIFRWLALKVGAKLGFKQTATDLEEQRAVAAIIHSHNFNLASWWVASLKHALGLHRSVKELYQQGRYFRQRHNGFDPHFLHVPDQVYIHGFWQSEQYFSGIEDILRQEFTLRNPTTALFDQMAAAISRTNAVSLHVRRGDMANDPETNRLHGVCSLDYYKLAVEYIAEHVSQPHFFIFSDDSDWVKENLDLKFPTTVVSYNNALQDYEELLLMSQCQHHITANSSFSWWGAWLNPKPDKIVVSPKQWFGAFAYDHDTKDLIPSAWTTL